MKIKILFNGPVRQLNGWKNVANIELPEGSTGYDLCDYFKIVPGKTRLYGFLIRDGKKKHLLKLVYQENGKISYHN